MKQWYEPAGHTIKLRRFAILKTDVNQYLSTNNRDQPLSGADFSADVPLTFGDERSALRTWVTWLTLKGYIKRDISLANERMSYTILQPIPEKVALVTVVLTPMNMRDLSMDVNALPLPSVMR